MDISKLLIQPLAPKKSLTEARPVILESRATSRDGKANTSSSVLERRDIEDIAHSILTGSSIGNRGLGGNYSMESAAPNLASSLLRNQYLSSSSAGFNINTGIGHGVASTSGTSGRSLRFMDSSVNVPNSNQPGLSTLSRTPSKKLPRYSLQSGYDKYVAMPTSAHASNQQFNRQKIITPQHVDTLLPLSESIMNPSNIKQLADSGLYMSRSFRVGWSNHWILVNPGKTLDSTDLEQKGPTEVSIEQKRTTSYGIIDEEQIVSLESWLEVCLENSTVTLDSCENDADGVPLFEPMEGIEMLSAFADEAGRQVNNGSSSDFTIALKEVKQVWDLMIALWGELPYLQEKIDEDNMEVEGADGKPNQETDSHEVTMRRKQAVSDWLESVVASKVKESVNAAKQVLDKNKSSVDEQLALLSGNSLKETCDRAQLAGDHYSAMLAAQAGGGSNSTCSQMLFKYMELLQVSTYTFHSAQVYFDYTAHSKIKYVHVFFTILRKHKVMHF